MLGVNMGSNCEKLPSLLTNLEKLRELEQDMEEKT